MLLTVRYAITALRATGERRQALENIRPRHQVEVLPGAGRIRDSHRGSVALVFALHGCRRAGVDTS